MTAMNAEPINAVEMHHITKRFPGVLANHDITFSVLKGEIHALLGENGAGKTTLMNILYGLYQADSGEIYIHGKKVDITEPKDAIALGIGMIHQHFMLIPPFTVAENVILGIEPEKNFLLDKEKAINDVKGISQKYGLIVDPEAKIQDLSVGIEQRVEILKALYRGAEILILDEPTAVLTPQEVEELFKVMKSLKEEGKTIIFITHKLKEPMATCDRITVLRKGEFVGTVDTEKTDIASLAQMMVGRDVCLEAEKSPHKAGEIVMEVKGLHAYNDRGIKALKGIDLELKKGEILGIAGVEGNGQLELAETLTGLRKAVAGSILIYKKDMTNAPVQKIIKSGVSHIPEDRRKRGLILDFSLAENLILGSHFRSPFSQRFRMDYDAVFVYADNLVKTFDIRGTGIHSQVKYLSGGNMQKVIVAREIGREPEIIIASQPTRGLDVGAIEYIHQQLLTMREEDKAILLISADLDEVRSLSDRIAVIYEGEIVGERDPTTTEEELGLLMAGGKA
jgi:simple sugar transport system ATP-binding protein